MLGRNAESSPEGRSIDFDNVIKLDLNSRPLEELIETIGADIIKAESQLNKDVQESVASKIVAKNDARKQLADALQGQEREYEHYKKQLAEWSEKRKDLIGDSATPKTKTYYEAYLQSLPSLETRRLSLLTEREVLIRSIYKELIGEAEDYRKVYEPIKGFIEAFDAKPRIALEIDVSIVGRGFVSGFSELINFGRQASSSVLRKERRKFVILPSAPTGTMKMR